MKSFVFLLVLQMILNPRGLLPLDFISRTKLTNLKYYISGNFAFWLVVFQPNVSYILGSLGVSQV